MDLFILANLYLTLRTLFCKFKMVIEMANFKIIAAIGQNGELGRNNQLLWHLKQDLLFFKEQTMNKKIVMGYKTYLSLPKYLPNRDHYVLTSHKIEDKRIHTFNNYEKLYVYLNTFDEDIFIIGGASIYRLFLPYCQEILLTEINDSKTADCFFPDFDKDNYEKTLIGSYAEEKTTYQHVRYLKK